MSEDDDERVEYRLSTTGKLVNATQERIDELMRLRADREKLSRPKPAVAFDAVLATAQSAEGALDPEAESLARSRARRERAQAMARAGLQPIKGDAVPSRGAVRAPAQAGKGAPPRAEREAEGAAASPALPAAPPAREATVIRAAPKAKPEPTKGPPPKAPPRAGGSKRTIIKG